MILTLSEDAQTIEISHLTNQNKGIAAETNRQLNSPLEIVWGEKSCDINEFLKSLGYDANIKSSDLITYLSKK